MRVASPRSRGWRGVAHSKSRSAAPRLRPLSSWGRQTRPHSPSRERGPGGGGGCLPPQYLTRLIEEAGGVVGRCAGAAVGRSGRARRGAAVSLSRFRARGAPFFASPRGRRAALPSYTHHPGAWEHARRTHPGGRGDWPASQGRRRCAQGGGGGANTTPQKKKKKKKKRTTSR